MILEVFHSVIPYAQPSEAEAWELLWVLSLLWRGVGCADLVLSVKQSDLVDEH